MSEGRKRWQKENCLKNPSSGGEAKVTHQSSLINKGQFPFRREEKVWSNERCFFTNWGCSTASHQVSTPVRHPRSPNHGKCHETLCANVKIRYKMPYVYTKYMFYTFLFIVSSKIQKIKTSGIYFS